ncbi:MAG: para-nitrobenzyl esterase [Paraglaciecola sp.]|jgi:para-nitrobenzyl esterase
MKYVCLLLLLSILSMITSCAAHSTHASHQVDIAQGSLQGSLDSSAKVRSFKGIPFAAPPVGDLRWRPPQAPAKWDGVRDAQQFGNQCMQHPLYSDMQFRSSGVSEDCLYLNVWTPAQSDNKKLPVLVYFYGGGFIAGDGSEKRYDGANMAKQGMVVVTVNYRLGVFGLMAHPQLSKESGYGGSGNYTFMDQQAALRWVANNVAAFGGDPKRITIAGESAGSISVSALMASPLSKDLIAGAIGESGSILGPPLGTVSLADGEELGVRVFRTLAGEMTDRMQPSIDVLRTIPAQVLLDKVSRGNVGWFRPVVDGYVFPQAPAEIYADGKYAKVPLLAGVNSQEGSYGQILGEQEPSVQNYQEAVKELYPNDYVQVLALYMAKTKEQVMEAAQALASDRFISYGTWNWVNEVAKTSQQATYYYLYDHIRPDMRQDFRDNPQSEVIKNRGAVHSAEIEYALGNLDANNMYEWQADDYEVSNIMQQYFVNFIKSGNPNGAGLISWPLFLEGKQLVIQKVPQAEDISQLNARYQFHHKYYANNLNK